MRPCGKRGCEVHSFCILLRSNSLTCLSISDYRQFRHSPKFQTIIGTKLANGGDAFKGSFIGHKIDIIKIDIDKHEQMFYPK